MADFKTAYVKYILPIEGGYSNLASDKGKETYAGITRINYPSWPGWPTIDYKKSLYTTGVIPRNAKFSELNAMVEQFYRDLWNKNRFGEINNQDIANLLFDFFVNSGYTAIKKIQKLVNVSVDGAMGNKTLAAVNGTDPAKLYSALMKERESFYSQIVKNDPDQIVNFKGWMNRLKQFPEFISKNAVSVSVIGILLIAGTVWYFSQAETSKKKTVEVRG